MKLTRGTEEQEKAAAAERAGGTETTRVIVRCSFAVLAVLGVLSIFLMFRLHIGSMATEQAFTVGTEAFSILVAVVIYYSFMQDPDSAERHTILFTTLIVADTCGIFLDEIAWLVQGTASLSAVNRAANTLLFIDNGVIAFQFWLYASFMLRIEEKRSRIVRILLLLSIVFITVLSVINFFVPVFFSVDGAGVYRREKLFPLCLISVVIMIPSLIRGMRRFDGPKKEKKIIRLFLLFPAVSLAISLFRFGISTQYSGVLLSILLILGVTVADRGKQMAVTRAELDTAMQIQESMLFRDFPAFPDRKDFEVYASMDPAREVGGDFYDFFLTDDDRLALVIADVSDKGVPAALFMASTKVLLNYRTRQGGTPAAILADVNDALCREKDSDIFVTAWLGILDVKTGVMTCANAGHEYPVIRGEDGVFSLLHDRHGLALGVMPGMRYHEYSVSLRPRDAVFVYTDGVPEANNLHEELYTTGRMIQALNSIADSSPEGILKGLRADVDAFVSGAKQFDDLTMLCMEYKG